LTSSSKTHWIEIPTTLTKLPLVILSIPIKTLETLITIITTGKIMIKMRKMIKMINVVHSTITYKMSRINLKIKMISKR